MQVDTDSKNLAVLTSCYRCRAEQPRDPDGGLLDADDLVDERLSGEQDDLLSLLEN
jgi:hypothetical protein